MSKHIINIAEVELQPRPPQYAPSGRAAERYEARVGMIAPQIGAKQLGYNLTAVPPGKRAYPFHSHRVQEEMFYVIEGETFSIRAGDIIACPTGGPQSAHQIVNTGKTELRYLAVSTKEATEICEYPDTGKIAGFGESLRFVVRGAQQVGYWEGE
jgi:uncharacterized cupin superfamily protein